MVGYGDSKRFSRGNEVDLLCQSSSEAQFSEFRALGQGLGFRL